EWASPPSFFSRGPRQPRRWYRGSVWFDFFRRRADPADRAARVLGADRVLVSDDECVDAASDYASVVEELCGLTGGALQFDEIACASERGMRGLSVRRGERAWRAVLEDDTDWVDTEGLLRALNDALEDLGLDQRFTAFEAHAGQATGYAWCTAEEASELRG